MNEEMIENSEPKIKRKLGDNILILYVETFAMILGGQLLGRILIGLVLGLMSAFIPYVDEIPACMTAADYAAFIGIWIVGLVFTGAVKKNRGILKAQWTAPKGNRLSFLFLGFFIGFILNGICVLAAWLNQDISLVFDGFHPLSFVMVLVCVFIQSAAEEFMCRGFLYQRLRKGYKNPWVAIIGSSLFFAVAHLFNEGVTVFSLINITLVGILFAMMVYYMDSIWCAYAVHTAWNITQNIVFGLPNSGIEALYSVWKLDAGSAKDSLAYNVGFGIEGTVVCDIVLLLACIAMFAWGRKFGKKPYDVWADAGSGAEG